ncbi:hypothetical protein Anas_08597 [Armadillidium nasatum]|uniref:Abscission/NoCut checkpoint regulator n=1 Tax=Armadillidium nasatum TaxID=96803 RepID=A0A5N5THP6_9CRUS|nr:hypothetical protein Anas_08597 [Armadillidium nasatum]
MSDPGRMPLHKQGSLSHIEQSLKIIPNPPSQAPVTIYPGPKAGNQNLSKADIEIADRLEKLRNSHVEEVPTEEEMALRLAKLKGLQSDHYTKSTNYAYQPPDSRTQVEKSEDLLKQVMGEVALDSKVVKPEEEIQARLSTLRGQTKVDDSSTTSSLNSSSVLSSSASSEPRKHEKSLQDEIAALMRQAQSEVNNASSSVKLLKKDPTIRAALEEAASKRGKSVRSTDSTSSEELYSGDDDVDEREVGSSDNGAQPNQTEKDEVNRVVNLYTHKVRRRKEKRKLRALKQKEKKNKTGSSSSSDRELSDSDLDSQPTSESEKLSDSD